MSYGTTSSSGSQSYSNGQTTSYPTYAYSRGRGGRQRKAGNGSGLPVDVERLCGPDNKGAPQLFWMGNDGCPPRPMNGFDPNKFCNNGYTRTQEYIVCPPQAGLDPNKTTLEELKRIINECGGGLAEEEGRPRRKNSMCSTQDLCGDNRKDKDENDKDGDDNCCKESKSHEGIGFCFTPDSKMATEFTVTIEPEEPDPLEYALDNGIMPIICGYMPLSVAPVLPAFSAPIQQPPQHHHHHQKKKPGTKEKKPSAKHTPSGSYYSGYPYSYSGQSATGRGSAYPGTDGTKGDASAGGKYPAHLRYPYDHYDNKYNNYS